MKIAVTSCSDPLEQSVQKVWSSIAQARPDHLILLGDQIYMDYGPRIVSMFWVNPGNGAPAQFFGAQSDERVRAFIGKISR